MKEKRVINKKKYHYNVKKKALIDNHYKMYHIIYITNHT